MTEHDAPGDMARLEARAEALALGLSRELRPGRDLWPRIAAEIGQGSRRPSIGPVAVIEPRQDLWPAIRARIDRADTPGRPRFESRPGLARFAAAAGVAAMAALTLVLAGRFASFGEPGGPVVSSGSSATAMAVELPAWMAATYAQLEGSADGRSAGLGETVKTMRRDFVMVRSERLQIEQALVSSGDDANLQAQWRHVYLAELRLIDETQRLANRF